MDDKTRVLLSIIRGMQRGQVRIQGGLFGADKPNVGDLVMCYTNPTHDYAIAYYVGPGDERDTHIVREIGSRRQCRIWNEMLIPIKGLTEEETWDLHRREYHDKVHQAFYRFSEGDKRNPFHPDGKAANGHGHRLGRLEFTGEHSATVYVRPHCWYATTKPGMVDIPYTIKLEFGPRTSVLGIQRQMIAQGYGHPDRKWEQELGKNPRAITRDDLTDALGQAVDTGNLQAIEPQSIIRAKEQAAT